MLDTNGTSGNGTGTITSAPAGISCGSACSASYADGTVVTLTAVAAANSDFTGWNGCTPTGPATGPCSITMTAAATVRATFTLKVWPLSVAVAGGGSVGSTPAGISCGAQCSKSYDDGTIVTLVPTPNAGAMFSAWGGACTGSGSCMVTMNQAQNVTAAFIPQVVGVSVIKQGNGVGTVTSTPSGISCGTTCNASYTVGTVVTLTASSGPSSDFTGWGGACTGTGSCVVTVAGATSVTATFTLKTWPLTVSLAGTGSGSVTSTPAGINCGVACNKVYDDGTMVLLSAASFNGSNFTGWSGACSGNGTCTVTMTQAQNVTASFTLQTFALTVTKSGLGSGGVTSNIGGISCGPTCSSTYNYNTQVTLTATPTATSTFVGWSGAGCTTGTCVVTMSQAQTVNAKFDTIQLSVTTSGSGFGTVSSSPAGISNCGGVGASSCSATYASGTVVTLTAVGDTSTQARLSTFVGWSGGGCSGVGACSVTMTTATVVTAKFDFKPNLAFVTKNMTTASFGGVSGADVLCANAASAGGLGGTYRALISTSTVTKLSRLGTASGWVRMDGLPLVNTAADAATGNFLFPLRRDNNNNDVGDINVWTASDASNCADFTGTIGTGTLGSSAGLSGLALSWGGIGCTSLNNLYCFGVDRAAAITLVPPAVKRIAFTTKDYWLVGGGLAAADAFCQTEATSAGLAGTFKALLATTSASASSRFSTLGAVWTRADGAPITAAASQMFSQAYWDTSPNMNAAGTEVYGNNGVWGGAASLMVVGTAASTCNDWSSTSSNAAVGGRIGYSLVTRFLANDTAEKCNSTIKKIACLQQ